MSHELSIVNGQAEAMYALSPAWHGLGTVVDKAPNSEEAIKLAHLDWNVVKRPLQTDDGTPADGWFATVRSDLRTILGVVSERYKIVQNTEAFEFVDSLWQDGIIKYESAGALKGGRVVWLLARKPEDLEIVNGDMIEQYILFCNHHDGSGAVKVIPTSVRVVCANTLRLAQNTSGGISIIHTGNVERKLKVAQSILQYINKEFGIFQSTAIKLAQQQIDMVDYTDYINKVFRVDEIEKESTKKRIEENIKIVRTNFTSHPWNNLPAIRGSKWAALNSVTQWADHQYKFKGYKSVDNQFYNKIFGSADQIKQRALELVSH